MLPTPAPESAEGSYELTVAKVCFPDCEGKACGAEDGCQCFPPWTHCNISYFDRLSALVSDASFCLFLLAFRHPIASVWV